MFSGYKNYTANSLDSYTVDIDANMREKALQFATAIINSNNQYSRLLPDFAQNNLSLQQRIEIQRTYVGKLGELAFLKYLNSKNIFPSTEGMFTIYQGQSNVDNFDFKLKDKFIDIKTGFRTIHSRLLINVQQFKNLPKDYYVAVHLNGKDIDQNLTLIDLQSVTQAVIKGYADYHYLDRFCDTKNFGEGLAKFLPYNRLLKVDKLLRDLGLIEC